MKLTVSKAFYMILAVMKSPVQVKINNTLKCLSIRENDYKVDNWTMKGKSFSKSTLIDIELLSSLMS